MMMIWPRVRSTMHKGSLPIALWQNSCIVLHRRFKDLPKLVPEYSTATSWRNKRKQHNDPLSPRIIYKNKLHVVTTDSVNFLAAIMDRANLYERIMLRGDNRLLVQTGQRHALCAEKGSLRRFILLRTQRCPRQG